VRGRGVGPCVAERAESSLPARNRGESNKKVAGGSGQTIKPRYHDHVAGGELIEHEPELGTVGLGFARHFWEHFFASGLGQLAHLRVHALAVGRYPRIAVNHAGILRRISATEKPCSFSGLLWCVIQNYAKKISHEGLASENGKNRALRLV
jgi:hypothetical protein